MKIWFGGRVFDREGNPVGDVHRVLVAPEDREVTHVIVREATPRSVIVPLDMVQGNRGDSLILEISAAQFRNLPTYREGEWEQNPSAAVDVSGVREPKEREPQLLRALDIEPNNVELKSATCVSGLGDGQERAPLKGLLLDLYTNQITAVVAAQQIGRAEGVELPAGWIDRLTSTEIHVTPRPERPEEGLGAWETEY